MGGVTLVTAPLDGDAVLPLAEAKAFLRVDGDDEAALIGTLRTAALGWVERYTGVLLQRRPVTVTAAGFGFLAGLPRRPVRAVTSLSYRDGAGAVVTLAETDWRVTEDGLVPAARWPVTGGAADAVSLVYEAGFDDALPVPEDLRAAALMLLGHLNRNREAVTERAAATEMPLGPAALCAPFRRWAI